MSEHVYITKYALSGKPTLEEIAAKYGDSHVRTSRGSWNHLKIGKDCFNTWGEAAANCEARRVEKIASLKKQIAKLERLTFVEPTEVSR